MVGLIAVVGEAMDRDVDDAGEGVWNPDAAVSGADRVV